MRPDSPSSEPVTATVVPSGRAKTSASMPRASSGTSPRTSRTKAAISGRDGEKVPTKVSPSTSISGARATWR